MTVEEVLREFNVGDRVSCAYRPKDELTLKQKHLANAHDDGAGNTFINMSSSGIEGGFLLYEKKKDALAKIINKGVTLYEIY